MKLFIFLGCLSNSFTTLNILFLCQTFRFLRCHSTIFHHNSIFLSEHGNLSKFFLSSSSRICVGCKTQHCFNSFDSSISRILWVFFSCYLMFWAFSSLPFPIRLSTQNFPFSLEAFALPFPQRQLSSMNDLSNVFVRHITHLHSSRRSLKRVEEVTVDWTH